METDSLWLLQTAVAAFAAEEKLLRILQQEGF